jgi:hypothetical protein
MYSTVQQYFSHAFKHGVTTRGFKICSIVPFISQLCLRGSWYRKANRQSAAAHGIWCLRNRRWYTSTETCRKNLFNVCADYKLCIWLVYCPYGLKWHANCIKFLFALETPGLVIPKCETEKRHTGMQLLPSTQQSAEAWHHTGWQTVTSFWRNMLPLASG